MNLHFTNLPLESYLVLYANYFRTFRELEATRLSVKRVGCFVVPQKRKRKHFCVYLKLLSNSTRTRNNSLFNRRVGCFDYQ